MTCAQLRHNWHKLKGVSREIKGHKPKGKNTMKDKKKKKTASNPAAVYHDFKDRSFSHDVTAAMLVFQTNRVGIGLFSYVKNFLCSHKFGTFGTFEQRAPGRWLCCLETQNAR